MSDELLGELDEFFESIRTEIDIYQRISPENEREVRTWFEQQLESNTNIENPEFTYKTSNLSNEKEKLNILENKLESAEINPDIESLYLDSLNEINALIEIAENIGNPNTVINASKQIYGTPSEQTIALANQILESTTNTNRTAQTFTSSQMNMVMDDTLNRAGLTDWNTEFVDKGSISVSGPQKKINIPKHREYTTNEIQRLPLHEVGAHAFRAANGNIQDYGVMEHGTGSYHATEEGLALLLEESADLSNPTLMRKYAGRVKAVQSVLEGNNYNETYNLMREHQFSQNQAWNLALRAHRGGGFIKDHIYLEGRTQVQEHLEQGGNIEDLMIGKISTDQATQLSENESIKSPEYLPEDIISIAATMEELQEQIETL